MRGMSACDNGGFLDQVNIGQAYSQFLHLLHAHRHAAHLLGGRSPATGQVKQTHASISIKTEKKQERKEKSNEGSEILLRVSFTQMQGFLLKRNDSVGMQVVREKNSYKSMITTVSPFKIV